MMNVLFKSVANRTLNHIQLASETQTPSDNSDTQRTTQSPIQCLLANMY